MSLDLLPGRILQIEVVLRPDEYDAHQAALGSIATTLAGVEQDVIPVVTSPVFKHGLSDEGLEGTAKEFEQQLERSSSPHLRSRMSIAREKYEESLDLCDDIPFVAKQPAKSVSDLVLTLATRRSFVDSLGSLDTEGVQRRIQRLRNTGGWMICILDSSEGVLVTNKKTEKLVDLLLEGEFGDSLDTQINPQPSDKPDIAVFGKPKTLEEFLVHRGIVNTEDEGSEGRHSHEEAAQSVWDMAELFEIFMSTDPPMNKSLADFEQWIHAEGTLRSHYKSYLLAIYDGMEEAIKEPSAAARDDSIKEIRASLTDALLSGVLHPYIVEECARVINTHVMQAV